MKGMLSGVRVVELGSVIMVPYAAQQLGDLGADVIKVEPPTGDMTRYYPPARHPGMGGVGLNLNRNKRSAVIDLKAPSGRDALLALIRTADVFLTNVRPQALARLRLGYEELRAVNPGVVYVNAQGFRSDSPLGTHAAYDDIIQAVSGLVWLNEQAGGEPRFVPSLIADKVCGLQISQSVLAALLHRARGGSGQHIEVPMADTMLAFNLVEHLAGAVMDGEFGAPRSVSRTRRAQRTADGWMCVLPHSDRNWRDLCTFAGRPGLVADPRFADRASRARNADAMYPVLEEMTLTRTCAEWQEFCDGAGIPASPVHSLESAVATAYAREGGLLAEAEHPTEGTYRSIARPVRYSADPVPALRPCPALGEHTDEVLREAGFDPALLTKQSNLDKE
ncbi:CaiB/BaiF CoA transferase family protein [Streptomyces sp. NPDC127190]|uniref:CaiB/BaiF CoA transferase family protein n=1 Tax=unclassified Streptomyces TaxID=2593676 RepID=UPI0036300F68